MNDEIKEIFRRMNDLIEHRFDKEYHTECDLFKDIQDLLDYITNLQQENERLNTELNAYKDEFCKDTIKKYELVMELEYYKSRCEKANEFIKKNTHEYKMFNKEFGHFSNLTNISIDKNNKVFINDLLKILNGD